MIKRILSIFLVAALMISFVSAISFAETNSVSIESNNVIDGGQGVGFYDNGTRADSIDMLEIAGNSIVVRKNEWMAYDVSMLSRGTYILSLTHGNVYTPKVDIYIDEKYALLDVELPVTGNYNVLQSTEIGRVNISDDTKILKIKSTSEAMYFDVFTLTKVCDCPCYMPSFTKNGDSVLSKVSGEGFYDAAGLEFSDDRVSTAGNAILHASDWTAYDLSMYPDGAYELSVCYASKLDTKYDVSVNGVKKITASLDGTDPNSYSVYGEKTLGNIYINSGSVLKICNSGSGATYLKSYTLRRIGFSLESENISSIKAANVLNGGQGVGFYDSNESVGALELSGSNVCLREKEWVLYDVSHMRSGKYKIYVETASVSNAFVNVCVDSKLQLYNRGMASTGSNQSFQKAYIGDILLSDNSKTLKFELCSSSVIYLRTVYLEMISAVDNLKYVKNADGTEEVDRLSGLSEVYLTGRITNYLFETDKINLISAFYSDDNMLISLKINSIPVNEENIVDLSVKIDVNSEAAYLKSFVWTNLHDVLPVTSPKVLYKGVDLHYYVNSNAQKGNDENNGTSEECPLKSIEEVKSRIRDNNSFETGDIYVHLKGEFNIDDTLSFDEFDSGKNGFSVIYDGNGETVISGGRKVEGFSKVSGTPLYKTKVENADFRQLYVNGNRAQRAKSKWLYYMEAEYDDPELNYDNPEGYYINGDDFPGGFKKPGYMEMVWMPSWRNVRMPVESIEKTENGDYLVKYPEPYFDRAFMQSAPIGLSIPFYFENAPEFLDEPGEWYYNKDTDELFYYPLDGEDMSESEVYIPKTEVLLTVCGNKNEKVRNITFKKIEFKYGAWNRTTEKGFSTLQAEQVLAPAEEGETSFMIPAQVQVDYGDNINFAENKFRHLGSVALSYDNETENSNISGNLFDDTSASAITISNFSLNTVVSEEKLCKNISVNNNLIRRVSVEYMTPAITAYYVNNLTITHNDIKDAPYSGISLGWGWDNGTRACNSNTVSYNKIENVLYKLKDGAHIYTLGFMGGTVIENNYMIKSDENKGGVYLDNGTTNITVRNNVFEKCPKWFKLTYKNIKENVAYNNYSESEYYLTYPEQNSIDAAIGKTDGVWPLEALTIIEGAGLTDSYKHLLDEYDANTHFRNAELNRMPYIGKAGITVPAGELIEGGEGVAYHDTTTSVGINYVYDGTGHKYIMSTAQGEWTKHKVQIPEDGEYRVFLCAATTAATRRASVWVDDVIVANNKLLKETGNYSTFEENEMGTINLSAGEHIVKVMHSTSNFGFYSLRFVKKDNDVFSRDDGYIENIVNAVVG